MTPAPRIGTEFAGYRIDGLLGRGGMGVVYRAEHPRLGVTVALKVMDPNLGLDEVFRERFVRESRLAARIGHPSIVPIYDAGEWHGDLYIAMRYIEGDDLRSILREDGALPIHKTAAIGAQIASALDAAHRSGLVHRDVKPANILVEAGPDPDSAPIAYLADLGLTKHVDSESGVTGTGELLGTIDYIAPEQISGARVDGRADVYSLACVLFECLTGSTPYVRENQAAVLWAHLHDDVPRATGVNPSLPAAIDPALARGMAKSREDRFSTCRELVAAVGAPLAAEAPGADRSETRPLATSALGGPAVGAPASGRRAPKRALVLGAAVGILLGGAGAAAALLLVPEDDTSATQTTSRQPTSQETQESGGLGAGMTPFDEELLAYVPDRMRATCSHAGPPTANFDASVTCRPGGVVDSVTYSHARSGFYLHEFLLDRMPRAGLPASSPVTMTGSCSTGDIPALNDMVSVGLGGRAETQEDAPREQRLGLVLCYRRAARAWIEWTTREVGVYAIATSEEIDALYDWWRREGGPEP
jgi:hypothetical protein